MLERPTGTVTFLFTDIEGSTHLWEGHPEAMKAALARHDAILREAVEANRGSIIKTTGDGAHAVFTTALDAITAALAAQRGLQGPPGEFQIKVRMGLHTGEAELRAGDYYGQALNRAVRLMSIAHGGQILLSASTTDLVRDHLRPGTTLRDLGEHRLKDLVRPEQVYQLTGPGLPAEFPPLRSLNALPNNLPLQLTNFIGREKQVAEVKRLSSANRLITLTGPGGTGKTRLSLQVGAELLDQFADGVWLIELAPLADPALVAQAVAAALQVREAPGQSLLNLITDYLRYKQALVMLDNCEHLITACARLADHLLQACPKLKILASSREALGIAGESIYRVPSLSLPDAGQLSPDTLTDCESVRLFLDRAAAAQSRFGLTAQNAGAVAQICQRLDGIPLALELAAARVKVFSAEQIAARLDDRFRLLTGGSRTALPRQQTLRALIDWSYDLLPDPERAALRQLSVFAGGWTFEAAEAVVGAEALDLLSHLVDRSLVVVEEGAVEARYRLLETIRQYAREKLFESHEAEQVRNRHLDFYLARVEIAEPKLLSPEMIACLDQLEVEQDNLRAALEWALENDPLIALRLVAVLFTFWGLRTSITEGCNWVKAALARSEAASKVEGEAAQSYLAARAKALGGEAALAFGLGNNRAARAAVEASISLARQINASQTLASSLGLGATVSGLMGDVATARAWADECIALCRQRGYAYELSMISGAHMFLAVVANEPLQPSMQEETLRAARESGNPWAMALAIQNVARVAAMSGNLAEAYTRFEEASTLFHQMRDRHFYNSSRSEIGHVFRKQGRHHEAVTVYRETIRAWQELGQRAAVAHELECFAFIAGASGQNERAARLFGAAEALRELIGSPMTPMERGEYEREAAALRAQMDKAAFEPAWAAGRALTMEQAIEHVLAMNNEQ